VKATVNIDNTPSHPNIKKLCSHDGDIKRLVLPSNTNAMIWPRDHGITVIIKMFYTHTRFLIERMVTTKQPMAEMHKAQAPAVTWMSIFCTVAPNIWGSLVLNLPLVTLLASWIFRWFQGFWKLCIPLIYTQTWW
jgi:hypothetical protein